MSSKREHVTDQREEAYQGVIVVSAPHPSPRPRCQGPFPFQNHRYFCWTGKGDYFIPSYTSGFTGLTRAVRYTDCFEIATDRYELTDSTVPNIIWTRVAWRAPWRQVVEENFEQAVTVPKLAVLRILGICGISRLPAEIAEMVMGYAKSSLLSRYGTAAEFADMLPTLPHNEIHSIPVRHILSWSRDSGLVPCVSVHCEPPIVRITIDANGIQAVERLYGHPKFLTKRVSNCLFVILSITELGNTIAYIRVSHLHRTTSSSFTVQLPNCLTRFSTIECIFIYALIGMDCKLGIHQIHPQSCVAPLSQTEYTRRLSSKQYIQAKYLAIHSISSTKF